MENQIIEFLEQNEGIYDQLSIYNKIVEDKEDINKKLEFLFKLNNITKYDKNISIIKRDQIYYLQYKKQEITDDDIIECKFEYQDQFIKPIKFYKYIINNNLEKEYIDIETNNTVFHDIIILNNYKLINRLISQNKFNYTALNKEGKTPLDYITDFKTLNIIIQKIIYSQVELKKILNEMNDKKQIQNKFIVNTFIIIMGFILILFLGNISLWIIKI
jgi:hypothetical protein